MSAILKLKYIYTLKNKERSAKNLSIIQNEKGKFILFQHLIKIEKYLSCVFLTIENSEEKNIKLIYSKKRYNLGNTPNKIIKFKNDIDPRKLKIYLDDKLLKIKILSNIRKTFLSMGSFQFPLNENQDTYKINRIYSIGDSYEPFESEIRLTDNKNYVLKTSLKLDPRKDGRFLFHTNFNLNEDLLSPITKKATQLCKNIEHYTKQEFIGEIESLIN